MLLFIITAEIWVSPCMTASTPFQKPALSLAIKVYDHYVRYSALPQSNLISMCKAPAIA